MNIFKPKLKLIKGTRFVSFLFIGTSVLIAAGILIAANMYYNIDTGEIVMEEIQRTTGLIRALGGVIIGGTSTSTLPAGVALEIATSSDVLLSGVGQLLRFSGGTANYVGFRATTTLTTTTVYTWPSVYGSTGQALITTEDGTLSWSTPAGMGTITTVGDISGVVSGGDAFTAGVPGEYLWFGQDAGNRGQLTVATLPGTATTWTLPNLTGTIALQAESNLSVSGGVVFADSLGRLIQDGNFSYATTSRTLSLGTASTANGIIRLYGGTSGYVDFQATTTGSGITYTWPQAGGAGLYLRTDTSGNLSWESLTGGGAVTGEGASGRVAFWTSATEIDDSAYFLWDNANSRLGIGTTTLPTHSLDVYGTARISNSLIVPLIQSAGALTLEALGGDILLNPSTYIVQLATSTYIRTQEGYEIGRTGTEILREMIPIMGFDLPVQTATTSYIQISRTLQNYPFAEAATGTERVHKLVFRYAASSTEVIDVRAIATGATTTNFTLSSTNNLEQGESHIEALPSEDFPEDFTNFQVSIQTRNAPDTVRIFQIFLAAYDQVQ